MSRAFGRPATASGLVAGAEPWVSTPAVTQMDPVSRPLKLRTAALGTPGAPLSPKEWRDTAPRAGRKESAHNRGGRDWERHSD